MEITATLLPTRDTANVDMTLSVSKSKTFDDCKAKFKFAYIEKLPRIDRDFHIFGKFLHAILEEFHKGLLDIPNPPPSVWEQHMLRAQDLARTEYANTITKDQSAEADQIIQKYTNILYEEGMPSVVAVEKEFYININNIVLLNGFIDRVQIDKDGMIHVADYKTTKDPKYLNDFFQLITYAYVLMLEDPSIKRVRASFILLRHNFDYITKEFTRDDILPVAEKFVKYANNIKAEKAWRPNPQFLCKYCDYLDHCSSGTNYLVKKGVLEKKVKTGIQSW